MFFERPQFLALLLLALPWIAWLRRQQPRAFSVGGLEPFRPYARAGGVQRRGWPWTLLCALAALVCGALALARPGFGGRPGFLVLDRTLSVRVCGLADPAARGRTVLECETDLLELLRGLPAAARVEVWTDRPVPAGLPARIRWNDESFRAFAAPNAAILVARPLAERRWAVHWLAEAGAAPLILVSDAGDRVELDPAAGEGVAELGVAAGATRLELRRAGGEPPDLRQDHDWSLEAGGWTIPDAWDARWEEAAAAARPGFPIRRAPQAAEPPFAADPLAVLSELDAVAFLAARLRAEADRAQPPRPASECRRPAAAGVWTEPDVRDGQPASPASAWLGAAGAVFLLLSLAACVLPSWRRPSSGGVTP